MDRDKLISDYRSDMILTFHKLVLYTVYNNNYFSIQEHVEWVTNRFQGLDETIEETKTAIQNNSTVTKCPKHGWVFCIKKACPNRCPKCYRNMRLYKKRVKGILNPDKSKDND